jgi:hypothetical protein
MADYSGLETLFNNLPATVAGLYSGEREALASYASQAETAKRNQEIQDLIQAHAQKDITNPLAAQKMKLENRGLEEELPGKTAQSALLGTQASTAAQTQASAIEATNSANSQKVFADKISRNEAIANEISKAKAVVDATPDLPGARHAALAQAMQSVGIDPNQYGHLFEQVPSAKLGEALSAFGDNVRKQSAHYKTEMEKEREKLRSQEKIGAGNNAATKYVADQRAETAAALAEAKAANAAHAKTLEGDIKENLDKARAEPDATKQAEYYARATQSAQLKAQLPGYGKVDAAGVAGLPANQITPLGPTNSPGKQRSPEGQAALDLLRKAQK